MIRLAVVVVSYNVRELLCACLASVEAGARRGAEYFETIVCVVDNASRDGSAAMVAAEFPQVQLLALTENLGFTGGNNRALAALGFGSDAAHRGAGAPDYVLLLNPDAEVVGDALRELVGFMQAHPAIGVCGPQLQYGDGSFQHGAFHFPSLAQVALDLFPLSQMRGAHRLHDSRLNGRYSKRQWAANAPFPVDFVLGAAMLVRGAAIRQVGGLDEAYFMYCEEMDWCLRMQDRGWSTYAVPAARVVHHAGQSSRQVRWAAFERLWRARFRFYRQHARHYPAGYRMAVRALVRLGLAAQRRQVDKQFARGEINGIELGEALTVYQHIGQL
jgi:N-acetylglucosaminyl-diphospho-decaprenol L-rhamnosyltransferase